MTYLAHLSQFVGGLFLLTGNDGGFLVRFVTDIRTSTISRRFHCTWTGRIIILILHISHGHVVINDRTCFGIEVLLLLRNGLVANGADLHHSLRTDGTCSWWRLECLDERKIRFLFGVRAAVQQPNTAGGILQGTGVTDEGGGVDSGRLSFPQRVISIDVGNPLRLKHVPLFDKVLMAFGTALHPSSRVHRPRPARTRMAHYARKERLIRWSIGQLFR